MGVVGLAALAANAIYFALLWKHRSGDSNMQSVWLCSRNDVIGNCAAYWPRSASSARLRVAGHRRSSSDGDARTAGGMARHQERLAQDHSRPRMMLP
jgi:hypothetical protein